MLSDRSPIFFAMVSCVVLALIVIPTALSMGRLRLQTKRPSPLPQYRKRPLLTSNEIEFFHRIKAALPEYFIFPQIAMSAIIEPALKGKRYAAARNRIDKKVVDFGIFDVEFRLICVIELDDSTHIKAKDEYRDNLVQSAAIKTLRWSSKQKPLPDEIRVEVLKLETSVA